MLTCLSLFLALVLTGDTTAQSPASGKEFVLKTGPAYGPRRLSPGWLSPSLLSCVVSCMASFLDDCQSVLYNQETHLCTPGQRLDPAQPPPAAAEGLLHLSAQCEAHEGFTLQIYGQTRACVFYQIQGLNYTDAQERCASMESVLYMVKDMDRFYLLRNIFKGGLWVGLNDMAEESVYIWSDGTKFTGNFSAMFASGEPNNYLGQEDCINMQHPTPFMLNDDSCNKTYNSVCEKPI